MADFRVRRRAFPLEMRISLFSSANYLALAAAVVAVYSAGTPAPNSAAMALTALFFACIASLFMLGFLRGALSPLLRLHEAVKALERSEPFILPEGAPGEIGEIARALSGLAERGGAWSKDLEAEAEAETRTRMLRLCAELCGVFAKDASDAANLSAVNLLKEAFNADATALFYISAKNEYLYCLAGADSQVSLCADRWRACVRPLCAETEIARFGPWSLPGQNALLPSWISYRLRFANDEVGYLFMGKAEGEWSEAEEDNLAAIAKTLVPIAQAKHERESNEIERQESEKKLAGNERRLRTFLEGSHDMIYTADSNDIVTGINAAGLALLKRSEKTEIVGKPFSSLALDPKDRELLLRTVRQVGYAADYEIVLKQGDGNSAFCLETAYAIRDPSGNIVELQGIVKDISERICSESALWKTNLELAEANLKIQRTQTLMIQQEKLASIGQLAAGIAHEINNPLGFLKSNHEMVEKYIHTIREAWEEAKASPRPDLAEIENRLDLQYLFSEFELLLRESDDGFARIMHIVANLKSFSRIEQTADFSLYDVNAGIENTLTVARNEIKYVAEVKEDLGKLPQIRARGSEINQVVLNLLVNAAQAIEGQKRGEKGLIEIRTAEAGDHVVIEICDDGPGIPEELQMRIFDPFFTTKEPGKGTGLGLSISYDIVVSKHGGRLRVDSPSGGGSRFTIELPVAGPPAKEG